MKEQMSESHQLLLTSSNAGPQEQKMIGKVQKLLSHMNEAIDWLTQNRDNEGGLLTAVSSESGKESQPQQQQAITELKMASQGIAEE